MKVFLSGSKTAVTLPPELTTLLDSYCEQGASFLIGDCFGADRLILQYLSERQYPNVTVYASGEVCRCDTAYPVKQIAACGLTGFAFYRQKDIAMIEDCDCAVMLWDGKTRGTRCNMEDMQRIGKPFSLIRSDYASHSNNS